MSQYTTYDFEESLGDINPKDVERVIAAWGDGGYSYAEWSGGFLVALKDGQFAYVRGWCDTSGWGCQDGRKVDYYDTQPDIATLPSWDDPKERPAADDWDMDPADLNLYLANEAVSTA